MELIDRQMALDRIDKARGELLAIGMVGAEHILVHYGRRVIEELPSCGENMDVVAIHGDFR